MNHFNNQEDNFDQLNIEHNMYSQDECEKNISKGVRTEKDITSLNQQMRSLNLNSSSSRKIIKSKKRQKYIRNKLSLLKDSKKEQAQYQQEYNEIEIGIFKNTSD